MLSIAKLAPGGQRYYLDQADGRVGHVRSVASGVEDYYLGGPEAAGFWIGSVARKLDLTGRAVTETALDRALSAADIVTGRPLAGPIGRSRVPGFDLTFSVPKWASLLWALGDERTRAAVWRAQRAAVTDAVRYLEAEAGWGRLGAGGAAGWFQGRGLLAAAFEHRTSRAGDPHIHTHVLVANRIERPDGSFAALDGRRLYADAKTAGFIHEAAFRHELHRQLGVRWTEPRRGMAEIDGVPVAVLRAFSRRRREIETYTGARGEDSRAARQVAAYRTREAKQYDVTPERLAPEWRERAARLGLNGAAIDRLTTESFVRQPQVRVTVDVEALVTHAAHFDRRDAIQQASQTARHGARLANLQAAVDEALSSREVIPLLDPGVRRDQTVVLRDGGTVSAAAYRPRYSTASMLAIERDLLAAADAGLRADVGRAHASHVDAAIAARPALGTDQIEMVRRLCQDGDAIQVVIGRAGSGKTYALAAATEAWARSGHPVRGAAVARHAARNLERHAHIPSTSIAALLHGADEIPASGVLVVDEAGMLPTRDLHELARRSRELHTKLVLVGDPRQLPEIEAGGAFAALTTRLPAIELTRDRRQQDATRRTELERLRAGDAAPALEELHRAGELEITDSTDAAVESLVANYVSAIALGEDTVMLAVRRAEVAALNRAARRELTSRGQLGPTTMTVHDVELAIGDRVLLRVNDRRLDVQNGARGTIAAIDPDSGTVDVALENRGRIRLDREYLSRTTPDGQGPLVHGYAVTGHAAQGATVDSAFVLAGDAVYREWFYVALSRARDRTIVVAPSDRPAATAQENLERLAGRVERSQAQTMALDHEPIDDVRELLTRAIGPRPTTPSRAVKWDRALQAVTALRQVQEPSRADELLGPQPTELARRLRWLAAHQALQRAAPARDSLERNR